MNECLAPHRRQTRGTTRRLGGYESQLSLRAPARLIVRNAHVRADIRFTASALLQGLPAAHLAPLTAIAALLADEEREAAERAAAEMYDDD